MKRIATITFAIALALAAQAQNDTISAFVGDDTASGKRTAWLDFGLSASATMYANGNDMSPYYSKYGFGLHLPLMAHYELNKYWTFSAGLQYDFIWSPLYYRVEPTADGEGIDFPTTPQVGTQHGYVFDSYLGFPIKASWCPFGNNNLFFTFDVHPAYAVTRHITLTNTDISRNGSSTDEDIVRGSSLQPWKLEVGITLGTSRVGLIHGLRFFTNLLPTYKDVVTGEKIYISGMSIFL